MPAALLGLEHHLPTRTTGGYGHEGEVISRVGCDGECCDCHAGVGGACTEEGGAVVFADGTEIAADGVFVAIGVAGMWLAVFADVGVMVLAVLNAIRALFVKKL